MCLLSSAALLFLAVAAPLKAYAGTHEVWWNITYVDGVSPDGLFERQVVGVNNTWPPPPIFMNATDDLVLHVQNSLNDITSMHHHGMFFNSTSWMDGAVGTSQCGIPPGESFSYVVPVSTSGQWGTYWAHAHAHGAYVDGLRTPMIISGSQKQEPYSTAYDEEFTVVLGDWYHQQHADLMNQFVSIGNPAGAEPIPDSALVYFVDSKGSYLPPIPGTTPASSVTSAVGFSENATLPFTPGKTYRLRVINTSAFAMFYFWIDGHDMRIIEVDGTDVEETPTDLIAVTVAQRYSVLVTARNDASQNWVIHANMDTDMFDTVPPTLNPNATSSVTYAASAPLTDLGYLDAYHDVNDITLSPVAVIPQLPPANARIELEVTFDTMDDGTNHAMFNAVTFNFPNTPAVLSQLTLGQNASVAAAYGPLSFVVDHLDVFDIVLKNGDAGKHPFHLHGHKFQMIGRAQDYTSDNATLNPTPLEGQLNPMRRDTVGVPSGTSVTLRVAADNPGVWLFHCHIEWHLEVGLAIQIIEAPFEAQSRAAINGPPSVLVQQCQTLGKPTSGNAAGHASRTDLSGLTLGPYPQKLGWHPKGIAAMFGCVLTAVLGMLTVTWYAFGGQELSEQEMEDLVRRRMEAKANRPKFFGLGGKRT